MILAESYNASIHAERNLLVLALRFRTSGKIKWTKWIVAAFSEVAENGAICQVRGPFLTWAGDVFQSGIVANSSMKMVHAKPGVWGWFWPKKNYIQGSEIRIANVLPFLVLESQWADCQCREVTFYTRQKKEATSGRINWGWQVRRVFFQFQSCSFFLQMRKQS